MSTGKKRRAAVPEWLRLDNAAKIYPAAKTRTWTAVFRLSVTLKEEILPKVLEEALHNTLARIPLFGYRLRRGLFWYYLDKQKALPAPQEDVQNPCARMMLGREQRFLFRVRYHGGRIAVEIFHSLADGTGGLTFLMTLVAEYVRLRYGPRIPENTYILDVRRPPEAGEWEDSFLKHAREGVRSRGEEKAYALQGTNLLPGRLFLITGIIDTAKLREAAHQHNATINTFLSALLLQAILTVQKSDPSKKRRRMPVKLSMPVNLRKYYFSSTLRNFASYFNASINPTYGNYTLEDIIRQVQHFAGMEGAEQLVNARMSTNVAAEKNRLLRAVPLFIKTPVLKIMYSLTGERYFTTTLSNMGAIPLPEALQKHVTRADFILGPGKQNKLACGVISVNDKTYINFSRTVEETQVERAFFTALIKLGVPVVVESNRGH